MSDTRPSKKQRELLSFIDGFIKGNGYGPSYREVMRALDYKSVSTVAVHVDGLIARGFLVKKDHSARSLEVVREVSADAVQPTAADKAHQAWLVKMIEAKFDAYEQSDKTAGYDELGVLVEAVRVLGFEKAYMSLRDRLDSYQNNQ